MAIPLLRTKFNIPPVQANLIRRERLLRMLDEGLQGDHLLSLICAPSGYGKTTLVSQWIQQYDKDVRQAKLKREFVWLTLDQGDNDLARFTSYLVTALQQIKPDLGQSTLATLQNVRSPSIHLIATLLINELSNLAESSIIVLEDYHTVSTQSVHDFMTFLIDHIPQQLHLLIISRSDPPLPLARLRARGQLTEIRLDDLAMTEVEIAEFLVGHMGLDLSPSQLHVLESRTEGWVAGLQLAMLSMRHTKNIPGFIQAFSGGYEYIADYLTKEVLEQQNESTQKFLLQTSILKQFTAPLCEAVTGQSQVTQLLEKLEQANIFLVPLDYQGEWYRYHALFADLLRKRLQQSSKEILLDLHDRAGRWYAGHMMWEQAIEHFLEGEDYDAAARSIEGIAERILMHGQTATILHWLDAFPIDQLYHHPVLIVYQGVAMMLLGKKPENALSMLEELAATAEKFKGEKDTLQALFSVLKGNALEAIRLSESALQQLPAERSFLRILAADSLAMSHALRGDLASALKAFETVVDTAQAAGNVIMMLLGLANLAGLHYQLGQFHQAWDDYKKVFDISREKLGGYSQPLGRVLLGMGELKREWNDLEGASKYLYEAAENFRQFIDIGLSVAYLSLARVYLSQGKWEKTQAVLEEARQHSRASKTTTIDDKLTELMQARLWIAQGELEKAEQWAQKSGLIGKPLEDLEFLADRNATAFELIQGEYLAFVRLLLAQNKSLKALDILAVIRTYNEKRSQMRRVIECLVLEAIAYHQQEADAPAMRAISTALTLAEPEGYIRTFLDEGQPVAQLLYQAINHCQSPAYARNLLTAFTKEGFQPPTIEKKAHEGQGLIEALSEREIEILKLIADGLTNQAIAMKLHVTLSTVKGHNSNIFSKLGVENRTQAVRMARDLDLL